MRLRYTYADELQDLCSQVRAQPLYQQRLAITNRDLMRDLNITDEEMNDEWWRKQLSDAASELQSKAVAQKYGGHQFGQWNPYLGDGRGHLLAEIEDKHGQWHDVHLKGGGPTPYSRHADGKAVLRSSIREYIASEALHALGIPTSRALCLFDSDEAVKREHIETAAMIIRTCPSHIRFGHFEYFHYSDNPSALDSLFDYCFQYLFNQEASTEKPHANLFRTVMRKTAELVADWQSVGFNHGVMNTDNMSILGITLDYGPYAFLDNYEPEFRSNKSDQAGRYQFDQQPSIALWNLNALAQAFTRYVSVGELTSILEEFQPYLIDLYTTKMDRKFGFDAVSKDAIDDQQRIAEMRNQWLTLLQDQQLDYTQSFRILAKAQSSPEQFLQNFSVIASAQKWLSNYLEVIDEWNINVSNLNTINPIIVPRNHHVQIVIDAAINGDFTECESLLDAVSDPFNADNVAAKWLERVPTHAKGIALSCSS